MWKKLTDELAGRNCEFRERMFRTVILCGVIAAIVAILEILFVMDIGAIVISMLGILLAAMAVSLFATFKYHRYDIAANVIGMIAIVLVFPIMFIHSAALNSGADVWLAFGFAYIFIMFTGKRRIFFLVLCMLSYALTYLYAIYFPESIVPMASETLAYVDSYFSVVVVGMMIGIILKTQSVIFEKEHSLALKQKVAIENSNKSKNILFAGMSHEIRTPITSIIGLNEMIMRECDSDSIREYARDIEIASKLLLDQINDILDLSQLEMQKMSILPSDYRTKELFGELIEMIRVRVKKKNLTLNLDIDQSLPSVLYGDERRLRQIFLNILDNAVKYTKEGSVTLSIHYEPLEEEELLLQVKVTDTGIGIRKEDMASIYDTFSRVKETQHSGIIGSGLGLSIAKQLVDMMQGEIAVDSIHTKGTTFSVTIKQKIVDNTPIGEEDFLTESMKTAGYQPSFEAPEAKVLVVDDNAVNATVIAKLLSETKMKLDTANSGEECLACTMKKRYNIILMDSMMTKMSGAETLQAVRNQKNGLCRESVVIALTADVTTGAKQKYSELGFDGYLEKPVHAKVMEEELLKFLPSDLIEYQASSDSVLEENSLMKKVEMRRRKKVCITTDCVCDLPRELLEKYDISLMYLYIKTPHGRFADTKEIDSDSLTQYISSKDSTAYVDNVTIEEYEEFFADALTKAEQVIHISMASGIGTSYQIATAAARSFDHVSIIDSRQIACGQSMVTLYAAKMAKEGKTAAEICREVDKMLGNIQTRFILPSADILFQNHRIGSAICMLCRVFNFHLYANMRKRKVMVLSVLSGSREQARKRGIYWQLHRKKKIDPACIFISHVGCSVEELEWIKKEVTHYVPFERVIIQKASFSAACNSGLGTIGITVYRR